MKNDAKWFISHWAEGEDIEERKALQDGTGQHALSKQHISIHFTSLLKLWSHCVGDLLAGFESPSSGQDNEEEMVSQLQRLLGFRPGIDTGLS